MAGRAVGGLGSLAGLLGLTGSGGAAAPPPAPSGVGTTPFVPVGGAGRLGRTVDLGTNLAMGIGVVHDLATIGEESPAIALAPSGTGSARYAAGWARYLGSLNLPNAPGSGSFWAAVFGRNMPAVAAGPAGGGLGDLLQNPQLMINRQGQLADSVESLYDRLIMQIQNTTPVQAEQEAREYQELIRALNGLQSQIAQSFPAQGG